MAASTDDTRRAASSLRRWSAAAIAASLVLAGFVTVLVVRSRHEAQRSEEVADAVTAFAKAVHRDPSAAARLMCARERTAYAASVPGGLVLPAIATKPQVAVSDVRRSGTTASVRVVPRRLTSLAARVTLTREDGRWRVCAPSVAAPPTQPTPLSEAAPGDGGGLCDPVRAEVRRARAAITAHNAVPHVFDLPAEQVKLDAYDATARSLNRAFEEVSGRLVDCRRAELTLAGSGSATLRANPSAQTLAALRDAGTDEASLARALRAAAPPSYGDVQLQGLARPAVGDPDPAFAGGFVLRGKGGAPAVLSVPVVSPATLVADSDVRRLSPRNLYAVAFSPLNEQWVSTYAAAATASPSMATVLGLAPAYTKRQDELAAGVSDTTGSVVRLLLRSQGR